jgi:hypothetical protein
VKGWAGTRKGSFSQEGWALTEGEPSSGAKRIAMLIDGDNAQPDLFDAMIAEASKYGLVSIRRIYGDWTTTNMNGWKSILNEHSIQPVQQFRYTTGKNATDSAMIIDAMDILYERNVTGFCLVSSDSDFTKLAARIREKGLFVMGIGNKATPRSFVKSCETFAYTEDLKRSSKPEPKQLTKTAKASASEAKSIDASDLLQRAVENCTQDDGWAFLGAVGMYLKRLEPGFDPRSYGHKQLSTLIKTYKGSFDVKEVQSTGGTTLVYVRLRADKP